MISWRYGCCPISGVLRSLAASAIIVYTDSVANRATLSLLISHLLGLILVAFCIHFSLAEDFWGVHAALKDGDSQGEREKARKPASDGSKLPPPAGSDNELLETAKAIGWPGAAFGTTCTDIERCLRLRLWQER